MTTERDTEAQEKDQIDEATASLLDLLPGLRKQDNATIDYIFYQLGKMLPIALSDIDSDLLRSMRLTTMKVQQVLDTLIVSFLVGRKQHTAVSRLAMQLGHIPPRERLGQILLTGLQDTGEPASNTLFIGRVSVFDLPQLDSMNSDHVTARLELKIVAIEDKPLDYTLQAEPSAPPSLTSTPPLDISPSCFGPDRTTNYATFVKGQRDAARPGRRPPDCDEI